MSVVTRPRSRATDERPVQIAIRGFKIGPEDTFVDVGCGDGASCRYAGSKGAAVVGIDLEPSLVEQADRAMRGVPARSWRGMVSDCDPIPLPDGSATVVLCTEVLEHVEDPARFAAELVRIGKPGARYLLSVPDPASEALIRHVAPDWYWRPPFHRRIFQHREFDALLREVGLIVERRDLGGSYQTIRWLLWWTLGREPYDTAEDSPLLRAWDRAWEVIQDSPRRQTLLFALEQALPKSQAVLASKPGGSRLARIRRTLTGPSAWKRRLRSGRFRCARPSLVDLVS